MADEIKNHCEREIARRERWRGESVRRDLHCDIPEVIHSRS